MPDPVSRKGKLGEKREYQQQQENRKFQRQTDAAHQSGCSERKPEGRKEEVAIGNDRAGGKEVGDRKQGYDKPPASQKDLGISPPEHPSDNCHDSKQERREQNSRRAERQREILGIKGGYVDRKQALFQVEERNLQSCREPLLQSTVISRRDDLRLSGNRDMKQNSGRR